MKCPLSPVIKCTRQVKSPPTLLLLSVEEWWNATPGLSCLFSAQLQHTICSNFTAKEDHFHCTFMQSAFPYLFGSDSVHCIHTAVYLCLLNIYPDHIHWAYLDQVYWALCVYSIFTTCPLHTHSLHIYVDCISFRFIDTKLAAHSFWLGFHQIL